MLDKPSFQSFSRSVPPLLVGNWEPYRSEEQLGSLLNQLKAIPYLSSHPIYLALPLSMIQGKSTDLAESGIKLGSHSIPNISPGTFAEHAAFPLLILSGARFVLLDTIQKRNLMEDPWETFIFKTSRLLEEGFLTLVRFGENDVVCEINKSFEFLREKLRSLLQDLPKEHLSRLFLVYSPAWITSEGVENLPANLTKSYSLCRTILEEILGQEKRKTVRILTAIPEHLIDCLSCIQETPCDGFLFTNLATESPLFLNTLESIQQECPDLLDTVDYSTDLSSKEKEAPLKMEEKEIPSLEEELQVEEEVLQQEETPEPPKPVQPHSIGNLTSWGSSSDSLS